MLSAFPAACRGQEGHSCRSLRSGGPSDNVSPSKTPAQRCQASAVRQRSGPQCLVGWGLPWGTSSQQGNRVDPAQHSKRCRCIGAVSCPDPDRSPTAQASAVHSAPPDCAVLCEATHVPGRAGLGRAGPGLVKAGCVQLERGDALRDGVRDVVEESRTSRTARSPGPPPTRFRISSEYDQHVPTCVQTRPAHTICKARLTLPRAATCEPGVVRSSATLLQPTRGTQMRAVRPGSLHPEVHRAGHAHHSPPRWGTDHPIPHQHSSPHHA